MNSLLDIGDSRCLRVGDRDGPAKRQPLRPRPAGARLPERHRAAHAGAAPQGRGRGGRDGGASGSAQPAVKLAFEFLGLTAARSGEVRLATWDEIDTAGAVWTISAERMKAKREHRVPLCSRALEVLDAARTLGGGNQLVFPMRSDKAISASTLPKMLQYQRIAAVAHGFRSSFRDWAAEETDHLREVIEAALAHVIENKVEAAYARSDLFDRRRQLMDDWAAYLDQQRAKTNQLNP